MVRRKKSFEKHYMMCCAQVTLNKLFIYIYIKIYIYNTFLHVSVEIKGLTFKDFFFFQEKLCN